MRSRRRRAELAGIYRAPRRQNSCGPEMNPLFLSENLGKGRKNGGKKDGKKDGKKEQEKEIQER